jgi:hypothetical protein
MMVGDQGAIWAVIQAGDKKAARRMLKPLLESSPTAELWYMASYACEGHEQEMGCLRQALKLNSKYAPARARYRQIKEANEPDMPTLDMLVDELPPLELLTDFPEPVRKRATVDIQAIKAEKRRQRSRTWTRLGCIGSVLMSLSLSYFVLSVIGSPIPAKIRQVLSGEVPVAPNAGTAVFGKPVPTESNFPNNPDNPSSGIASGNKPSINTNTSLANPPTPDGNPQTYADDAAAGGFVVQPNKTAPLKLGIAVTDVLDAGFAHEYTFTATTGEEIAIAIQFFSPTAKAVAKNVAVLDADDVNAESHCERDEILVDGSSTAFICQVHKGGTWKLQVFGRDGESTGVYVVTYDRM